MIVAVHQPNYFPWLGYFAKMAQADVFVFLDDVQFSKGSFTNRVRILRQGQVRWLTLPVKHDFGATVQQTRVARADWAKSHRDLIYYSYRSARAFREIWPDVEVWLAALESSAISDINSKLILDIAKRLSISPRIQTSSRLQIAAKRADERLVDIVNYFGAGGTYLAGKGGETYQDPQVFMEGDVDLQLTKFRHPVYPQKADGFIPGLSVLDAAFELGWDATRALIDQSIDHE